MSIIAAAREAAEKRKAYEVHEKQQRLLQRVLNVILAPAGKGFLSEDEYRFVGTTLLLHHEGLRFGFRADNALEVEAYDDEADVDYWVEIKNLADLGELTFRREYEAEQAAVRG